MTPMKAVPSLALVATFLFALGFAHAAPPPGWTEDYAKAIAKAKAENKNLLLDFTGSDWCGYCVALDNEVFSTAKFKSWAKDKLVLVKVDFPHNTRQTDKIKEQNAELKKKFPPSGYPTILVVDADEKVLAKKSGYSPGSGPKAYIEALDAFLKK
jgi:protein disulfide-isomerase